MNQVALLKEKANNPNYAYLKLLQKYKFDSSDLHYIFEGFDDQSFYFNYMQPLPPKFETYISLGKKNSINIYDKIDWLKYSKNRIVFFIDRDFDRFLGEPVPTDYNIYETTFYSIENYICSKELLNRMIRELLHYHDGEVIEKICNDYTNQLEIFCKKMFPILVWIYLIRKTKIKANLNMIDLSKIFKIDNNLKLKVILTKNKISYLEKATNIKTPHITLSEVREVKNTFDLTVSYKEYMRGKYELWFLITYFNKLNLFLMTNHSHNSKMKTSINTSNSIEIIGPRVLIPERFAEFLQNL